MKAANHNGIEVRVVETADRHLRPLKQNEYREENSGGEMSCLLEVMKGSNGCNKPREEDVLYCDDRGVFSSREFAVGDLGFVNDAEVTPLPAQLGIIQVKVHRGKITQPRRGSASPLKVDFPVRCGDFRTTRHCIVALTPQPTRDSKADTRRVFTANHHNPDYPWISFTFKYYTSDELFSGVVLEKSNLPPRGGSGSRLVKFEPEDDADYGYEPPEDRDALKVKCNGCRFSPRHGPDGMRMMPDPADQIVSGFGRRP
ncbi:hypothetical protein EHS25_004472 [Saitozyma podzolica]|uniref:Uncharacterized protein n=1 Tax=Saitozyma podzolica TaxID=1890683 RepID=A0A427YUA1_9TREE|nr:hypothetical protein EHS25_004472 [Saitozyma podzolica]